MTDQKPPRRISDPNTLRKFRLLDLCCLVCGGRPSDPHHVLMKSRGGDDLFENLVPLCRRDHDAFHGSPYYTEDLAMRVDSGTVRFRLARWLETDDGRECRAYLVGKLGRGPAQVFMHREFGIRDEAA